MPERRRYYRLPLQGRLLYRVLDDEAGASTQVEAVPADICINGMGFFSPQTLEEGVILQLTLQPSLQGLGALEREAVVVGCQEPTARGCYVSSRFTSGEEADVVRMMLRLYQHSGQHHTPPLSQLGLMCGPEDLERWPFFAEGRDCWEVEEAPCGPHTLDDCATCAYAALAFLLWVEPEHEAAAGETEAEAASLSDKENATR